MLKALLQRRMRKLDEKREAITNELHKVNEEIDFYEAEISRWQTKSKAHAIALINKLGGK